MEVNKIPMWEAQDVLSFAKVEMLQSGFDTIEIEYKNYQISDDIDNGTDKKYYEIYSSYITIDEDTTPEEFNNLIIENESLSKSFKTHKGLINHLIKNVKNTNFNYSVLTII